MTPSTLLIATLAIVSVASSSAQDCVDRNEKWTIARKTNNWCVWAAKQGPSQIQSRCDTKQIWDDCPKTCGTCSAPSIAPSVADTDMPTIATPAPTEATPAPTEATPAPTEATPAPTEATPAPTVAATVIETSSPTTAPVPPPGGRDDPHLWTWEGEMYDYHGQCDLIYTTCPKFDHNKGLRIHLRTEFVEPMKWSTIASLAVQIGDDVLEVENNGAYHLNQVALADLTDAELAGHDIAHRLDRSGSRDYYSIKLTDDMSINIKVKNTPTRDSLSFTIDGVHEHRRDGGTALADCGGLTSTWEHPEGSRFLVGRSGTAYAEHEAVDFGPEWQVDFSKNDPDLFMHKVARQLPNKRCDDSPLQSKDRRHLKKLEEADDGANSRRAEEACSHLLGNALFDSCYFDVLVTGDVTFAEEPWYTGEE